MDIFFQNITSKLDSQKNYYLTTLFLDSAADIRNKKLKETIKQKKPSLGSMNDSSIYQVQNTKLLADTFL